MLRGGTPELKSSRVNVGAPMPLWPYPIRSNSGCIYRREAPLNASIMA
jgi:hypothetical protein